MNSLKGVVMMIRAAKPVLLLSGVLFLIFGCVGAQKETKVDQQQSEDENVEKQEFSEATDYLDFVGSGNHLFVQDVDGDGLPDLGASSHGGNYLQIFFQDSPRRFTPGEWITEVGFHAWHATPFKWQDELYLMVDGEGSDSHTVLKPKGRQGVDVVSSYKSYIGPRASTPLNWPGWQNSWISSPYSWRYIAFLKNFDVAGGKVDKELTFDTGQQNSRIYPIDIEGDGIDEYVFSTRRPGKLWVARYAGEDRDPIVEVLFQTETHDVIKDALPLDIDDDGDLDLVLGQERYGYIDFYANDGKGNFSRIERTELLPAQAGPAHMTAAVDKDGTQYIATGNYKFLTLLHRKVGEEKVYKNITRPVVSWANFLVLEDIDGDGWLDLAFVLQRRNKALVVVYGPLLETFEEIETLDQPL